VSRRRKQHATPTSLDLQRAPYHTTLTGGLPEGKMDNDDEGELRLMISREKGTVRIDLASRLAGSPFQRTKRWPWLDSSRNTHKPCERIQTLAANTSGMSSDSTACR
jgi:hypothetical protein